MTLTEKIKQKVLQLGFDLIGITGASPLGPEHLGRFEKFINPSRAAQMSYLKRNLEKRIDPVKLFLPQNPLSAPPSTTNR